MKKSIITLTSLLVFAEGIANADVAAQFEIQAGGISGKGVLGGVPLIWESSVPIEKTLDPALLRVNHFSGQQISFSFQKPVNISSVLFYSLNPSSKNKITFYDGAGAVIPLEKILVASPSGVTDLVSEIKENVVHSSGITGKDAYPAVIGFPTEVKGVRRVTIEMEKEVGILDIRLRGSAGSPVVILG